MLIRCFVDDCIIPLIFVPALRRCACRAVSCLRDERYGVLSTYVQDFGSLGHNLNNHWEVSHLCEVFFPNNQPRNQQARVRAVCRRGIVSGVAVCLGCFDRLATSHFDFHAEREAHPYYR